jgi:hypothetical protein
MHGIGDDVINIYSIELQHFWGFVLRYKYEVVYSVTNII